MNTALANQIGYAARCHGPVITTAAAIRGAGGVLVQLCSAERVMGEDGNDLRTVRPGDGNWQQAMQTLRLDGQQLDELVSHAAKQCVMIAQLEAAWSLTGDQPVE